MKYIKRPLVVDAFKFDPLVLFGSTAEQPDWFAEAVANEDIKYNGLNTVEIRTSSGKIIAAPGDYIVHYENGDLYAFKEHVFNQIFEKLITPDMLEDK